jgi:hypothetical protein
MPLLRFPLFRRKPNLAPQDFLSGSKVEQIQTAFAIVAEAYQGEIDRRHLEQHPVKVFSVATDAKSPALPGGSALILTANPKDDTFRAIVEAAASGDAAKVSEALTAFENTLAKQSTSNLMIPADPIAQLSKIPLLAQVAYRGRVLADGMVVGNGHAMSLAIIPWAGGQLDPDGFHVNYFYRVGEHQPAKTQRG